MMRLLFKHPNATLEDMFNLCREGSKKMTIEQSEYRETIRKLDRIAQNFFEDSFFKGDPHGTKEQLASRLRSLLSSQMLARMLTATDNKLDLYRFMEDRKIVLVSTAGLGKEGPLFGRFVLSLAVKAAYQRQIDNNNPCLLFIDEASTMLDTNIDTILNKTRKYGLFVRFATQLYAQIPDKIRAAANANTTVKLTGGLTASDAQFFANDMHSTAQFLASTEFSDREFTEFACYVQHHTPTAIKLKVPLGQLEREPTMDTLTYQAMRNATRGMLRATTSRTVEASIQEALGAPRSTSGRPGYCPLRPQT